jgi:hypothetical protein
MIDLMRLLSFVDKVEEEGIPVQGEQLGAVASPRLLCSSQLSHGIFRRMRTSIYSACDVKLGQSAP